VIGPGGASTPARGLDRDPGREDLIVIPQPTADQPLLGLNDRRPHPTIPGADLIALTDQRGNLRAEALIDSGEVLYRRYCLSSEGYAIRGVRLSDGSRTRTQLAADVLGIPPGQGRSRNAQVPDHINTDRLDNRSANLRVTTNSKNSRKHSEQPGAYFDTSKRKWVAQATVGRRKVRLGNYATKDEAIAAYRGYVDTIQLTPRTGVLAEVPVPIRTPRSVRSGQVPRGADGIPHGTEDGYGNHGCRCDPCRKAKAIGQAIWRRRQSLSAGDPRHGTVNGYANYRCRCSLCKDVAVKARRRLLHPSPPE
jgi:hypothetical protein